MSSFQAEILFVSFVNFVLLLSQWYRIHCWEPLYFVCPSCIHSTSLFIYSSKWPGVWRGLYTSTVMAHLTMRLSGVCIHTQGTILITYYLTFNVFSPFFVCMSWPPPHSSPALPINKWKNIHCPGLLLNFSLSASNLKRSCCDVTRSPKQRKRKREEA